MKAMFGLAIAGWLAGCDEAPGDDAGTTDAATTGDGWSDVLRDCAPDPGTICPYAGSGYNGVQLDGDADRLDAWFSYPTDIALSAGGRSVIFDWNNGRLRAVNPDPADGLDTVVDSEGHPARGVFRADGTLLYLDQGALRSWDPVTGTDAIVLDSVDDPMALAVDGNLVYWVDAHSETVRRWDQATGLVDTVAGNGTKGIVGVACPADPQPALGSCFNFPKNGNPEIGGGLALDAAGQILYVADSESHVIRAVDLVTGTIDTVSGTPGEHGFADGPADQAAWYYPTDLEIDGDTLLVADTNNHRVRQIDLTTATVSTLAGTGHPSCEIVDLLIPATCEGQHDAGDGGLATEATLYRPFGVALDPDGNVVITDTYDQRLRTVYR